MAGDERVKSRGFISEHDVDRIYCVKEVYGSNLINIIPIKNSKTRITTKNPTYYI